MATKSNLLYTSEERLQIKYEDAYATLRYVVGTLDEIKRMKKRNDRADTLNFMHQRVKCCLNRLSRDKNS